MPQYVLREKPTIDDASWEFSGIPAEYLVAPPSLHPANTPRKGKLILFSPEKITLELQRFSSNRVVINDDVSKLVSVSFARFRFPDVKPSISTEYMMRFFKAGLFLNGVQYRFFGHGNSQMRGRGCYLREADTDEELDRRIYAMGDLEKIMNVAKRAKRIGLLFSGAEIDYNLDPRYVGDIDDLTTGDENFSDGCGLISRRLRHVRAMQISREKRIVYQGKAYTPVVMQIRYKGYKGVVMLHPELDKEKKHLIEFRKSMKKFNATADNIFAVVAYSVPYSFGRLNNEIVVLLSSLGISNETFIAKQGEYFRWIQEASQDPIKGFEFLSSMGKQSTAEKLLLQGLDTPNILKEIRASQMSEVSAFRKNDDLKKERVRMLIHKSRRLFGVADPYRVLREGEVHVRITTSRNGASTIRGMEVIVVRNPCLHPGDILKLKAVDNPKLAHLVDCVVFASVGRRAAPSMSSGGDLDGDEYFVCWDPSLIPARIAESYTYPPNKEPPPPLRITRQDLARHFAFYNGSGMAQTSALHNKWARYSPDGALCKECQELNALYSQAVDGARVTIPDRLRAPPVPEDESQFVLNQLFSHTRTFAEGFLVAEGGAPTAELPPETADELIVQLLSVKEPTVSEYKLINIARGIARKYNIDFRRFLSHVNFGALMTHEKYELAATLDVDPATEAYMWNSLLRSDILAVRDLTDRNLGGPLRVQRLFSSKSLGLTAFFDYLGRAIRDFTRKLLIIKLFNQQRANTFVHIRKPPINSGEEMITSIALQQLSARVQRQMGRVNRTPVVAVEIHVVSNRDRVAHQLFDLRFERVPTEEYVKRFAHQASTFQLNKLEDLDSDSLNDVQRDFFELTDSQAKSYLDSPTVTTTALDDCAEIAWKFHVEDRLFWIFKAALARQPLDEEFLHKWLERHPLLAYCALKAFPPSDSGKLPDEVSFLDNALVQQIIRSANVVAIAALAAFEKLRDTIASLSIKQYLDLLDLVPLAVRSPQLVQEVLFVLHECREGARSESDMMTYIHKRALAVACDRAEEAGDECPCDEDGNLKRQRKAPALVPLLPGKDSLSNVIAHIRVDAQTSVRLHSHVRLRSASRPEKGDMQAVTMDGVVTLSQAGEVRISLIHTPPPEYTSMQWYLYDAGSIATFRAMIDALGKLARDKSESCRFYRKLISSATEDDGQPDADTVQEDPPAPDSGANDTVISSADLNASQRAAVLESNSAQLSLIWGPPAVDNVLERFVKLNRDERLCSPERIIRFATDRSKVTKALQSFTIEGRVGGEIMRDSKRREKAEKLVEGAAIVFTTCAGAGLGILRTYNFDLVLIDEASQLRPMVRSLGHALQHDVSLFERLYTGPLSAGIARTMLDVQYRFPEHLARFPSAEFYDGRLQTGTRNTDELLRDLLHSKFPWPQHDGAVQPVVFVQCSAEEDYGGMSKSNEGQAELIKQIIKLLRTSAADGTMLESAPQITALSPYTKHAKLLQHTIPASASVPSFTIDSFQGRESDIIIFSTVRCNTSNDIGFVEDARRLNVAWTRAKLALIVVGDRRTMTASGGLWKRAIDACVEVKLEDLEGSAT
ncbi:RdRP-domain-containing protein [Gloeopeniophorella convolvens]|nr:RdRP-domain-containing protein [Gloeopeniophorella convolvens]